VRGQRSTRETSLRVCSPLLINIPTRALHRNFAAPSCPRQKARSPLRPRTHTASRRGPRSRPQPAESSSCRVDSNTKAHTCSRSMGATPVTCPDPRPRVAPSHCPADANCSPHQAVDAGSAGWLPGSSSVAIERSAAAAVEATVRAIVGAPGRAASSSSRVATRRSRVAPDEGGNQEVIRSSSEAAVRGTRSA
jgi:hypothetical protein